MEIYVRCGECDTLFEGPSVNPFCDECDAAYSERCREFGQLLSQLR